MKAKDSFKVEKVKELKKLHGHCRLELLDGTGKVIKSQEHDNTVTPWIANAINKGNFFDSIPSEKEFPLANWFSGVMLLSKQGDATQYMIPSDARVIACANNVSGSDSTDLRRGNYNQDSSSPVVGDDGRIIGYKNVWYWPDTRGNCIADEKIKAVCLTRPTLAIGRYEDTVPPDTTLNEILTSVAVTETLASCQIIDYENECAYNVTVSNGDIIVKKYQVDTKQFHLAGVYNSDSAYDVTKLLHTESITPQTAIASFSNNRASVSYVNGIIHLLTWSGSTLVDHAIDPSDWSETSTTHTYNLDTNVSIKDLDGPSMIIKDGILYDSGYLWFVTTNNKIIKANLSNDVDIDDFDMAVSNHSNNGPFVAFENGDWIKYSYNEDNVQFLSVNFYHDGTVYAANDVYNSPVGWGCRYAAVIPTGYGTLIMMQPKNGRYGNDHYISIAAPVHHVTTVWNIDDDTHEKNAGLTMRVIYELREQEGA